MRRALFIIDTTMIIVKNLAKNILGELLFEEVCFVLHKGDTVALVGPNGCGKSTLLKIITGDVEADAGDVRRDNERVGYLPQEVSFKSGDTVESFLSVPENLKVRTVFGNVGLDTIPYDFSVGKLSGGQKTRLALVKMLLERPSILLLDEPTNHLDLKGLEWLERFLCDFKGAVLIVSHDRRLLDTSVNRIFEIDSLRHRLVEYAGGYTDYMIEKEKKLMRWEDDYRRQQKEKRRMELWLALKRQEAHVHPDPAKGKQIRAMEKRLQREIYDNEIFRPGSQKKISGMELSGKTASAKRIVLAQNIAKSFSGSSLLWDISFEVRGREHVLLSGENGSGKTTLLKIITGELRSDRGEVKIGDGVRFGYFAQEHETLDPGKTVMEEFLSTDRLFSFVRNPRSILGAFLFSGQSVFKKISSLSLGERVRLIFAKLTNQENELLILDEPTNHLDLQSREVIEDALLDYKGAILVVSHDRYFLDTIGIDRTITICGGKIKESLG